MGCYPASTDWGTFNWETAKASETERRELVEEFAWSYYARLVAHTIATCPVALRPARVSCTLPLLWSPSWSYSWLNPYIGADGLWRNAAHAPGCACSDPATLLLPARNAQIDSVQIGSAYLDPSAYRVDNGNLLVRQDGGVWPVRQDMNAPAGNPDTFTITFFEGARPGALDSFAVGVIAQEALKVFAGDGKGCRLPLGTTNLTRSGTTVTIDPALRSGMLTGLPEVDQIVKMRNPNGIKRQSRVYSPDAPKGRITTSGSRLPTSPNPNPGSGGDLVPAPGNDGYYILQGV